MKEKILVVEDDKELRSMLEEILATNGYTVFAAKDADDAFEKLEEGIIPDLIVSDIMMPGKSGLEFLEEFKKRYLNADIPFMFLTAKAEDSDVRRGMNLGAEDYLKKPFKVRDLLKSVGLRLEKQKKINKQFEPLSRAIELNIAHELRTPLIPILGYSDIILDDAANLSESEIIQYMQYIKSSGSKMSDRIKKLLVYQRLEIQNFKNEFKLYKYLSTTKTSIERITSYLFEIAEKYNRSNDLSVDCEHATLAISYEHLKLVLSELTDNSFYFSAVNSKIIITGRKENDVYSFVVADNGVGICEKGIQNLSSDSQSRIDNYENSTGFGLAIIKEVLKIYDSHISIKSSLSGGTTVSFSLCIKQ